MTLNLYINHQGYHAVRGRQMGRVVAIITQYLATNITCMQLNTPYSAPPETRYLRIPHHTIPEHYNNGITFQGEYCYLYYSKRLTFRTLTVFESLFVLAADPVSLSSQHLVDEGFHKERYGNLKDHQSYDVET